MRKLLAILLAPLFFILFLLAITLNQVTNTVTEPDVVIGMMNDGEFYDYAYDNIIANMVRDTTEKGIDIEGGLGESAGTNTLMFDDPDAAAVTIIELIETLVPRELVKEKFEESLSSFVPYIRGDTDEFIIDLEVQQRVLAVPDAARDAVRDLDLAQRVIDDLLVPQVNDFSGDIFDEALGIGFTPQENEANARRIFAPDWLETQLFLAIDEITPYFAGEADHFNVVMHFDDRIVIVGQILKAKLGSTDVLYNLVFAQVVDPVIKQTVAQSTSVGYGISLTEPEVVQAFEVIAPREWVREQGNGVVDALVDYLIGTSNSLDYVVYIGDRKAAATGELQALARTKLRATLTVIPPCSSQADALAASQALSNKQLPECNAGGQTAVDVALNTLGPIMDQQVESFVESQVPSEVAYSLSDFESQVGGNFDVVTDLRDQVTEGVSFTEQDLINAMADETDPESRADAEEMLQILADGVLITEENIEENLEPDALEQFNDIRDYVNLGLRLRWLVWIVMLLPLIGIAFLGGRTWAARLKWAGGIAAVCGIIIYAGILISWSLSLSDIANDQVPAFDSISPEFSVNNPHLTAELESGELKTRVADAFDSFQNSWRNQAVPWIIAGVVAFAAGVALSRGSGRRPGGKRPSTIPWPGVSGTAASGAGDDSAQSPAVVIPAEGSEDDEPGEEADRSEESARSESDPEPEDKSPT